MTIRKLAPYSFRMTSLPCIVLEDWRYVVFFVRLKTESQLIKEVETVRVRRADNIIFAPRVLIEAEHPFWEESIPVMQRHTRQELIETTNAYFIAMETEGTDDYQPAAFNEDCNRWENGMRTSNVLYFPFSPADQFDLAFYKGNRVPIRRYPLVDVERGVVVSLVVFEADDCVPALVAEIFKIENSAISGIQAVYLGVDDVELPGWEGNYSDN